MKYMVMECHLSYAVVLDEGGRFLRVANRHYQVGQTVTDVVQMQVPQAQPVKKTGRRWIYSLGSLAACLVLIVTTLLFMGQMPYASVYMTINPEVRIDVTRSDIVVGLAGMNADGEDLIQGYDYRKKDLDMVMDELVDRAIDMGYLHEGGQITLTLDADDDEWVVSHSDDLPSHLSQHLTQKLTVTIEVTNKASSGQDIIIPVEPGGDYGESDYGQASTPSTAPTQQETTAGSAGDSGYTDYGEATDNGQTDYQEPTDDNGQSDYAEPPADDGQSDYEGPSDDGDSDYAESDTDDGQSDYEDDD